MCWGREEAPAGVPQRGGWAAGEEHGRELVPPVVLELEAAVREAPLSSDRRPTRIPDALQADAVLVAPEILRGRRGRRSAHERRRDGAAGPCRCVPVAGAYGVPGREHVRVGGTPEWAWGVDADARGPQPARRGPRADGDEDVGAGNEFAAGEAEGLDGAVSVAMDGLDRAPEVEPDATCPVDAGEPAPGGGGEDAGQRKRPGFDHAHLVAGGGGGGGDFEADQAGADEGERPAGRERRRKGVRVVAGAQPMDVRARQLGQGDRVGARGNEHVL